MKAEHRHELKTNALAEWMGNFPEWFRGNLISVIIVIATIVAAAGFLFWRSHNKNARLQEQYRFTSIVNQISNLKMQILGAQGQAVGMSSGLFEPARNLAAFAQDTGDNNLAALAFIKQAEALRTELHYRSDDVSNQDLVAQVGSAKQSYAMAVEKASDNPSLMASAKFGLGLCEEELGNFDAAKQIYAQIAADAAFQGTVSIVQAKLRLETMDDYKKNLVFRPKPKPKPQLTPLEPVGVQMGPVDTNKPAVAAAPNVKIAPLDPNAPAVIKKPVIDANLPAREPKAIPTKPPTKASPPEPNAPAKAPVAAAPVLTAAQDANTAPKAP